MNTATCIFIDLLADARSSLMAADAHRRREATSIKPLIEAALVSLNRAEAHLDAHLAIGPAHTEWWLREEVVVIKSMLSSFIYDVAFSPKNIERRLSQARDMAEQMDMVPMPARANPAPLMTSKPASRHITIPSIRGKGRARIDGPTYSGVWLDEAFDMEA